MLTGTFLFLLISFTVVSAWLSWKNDFSAEVEGILFKAIGAIAVAAYFMINTFLIKAKKEITFRVTVPVMYEPSSGTIFSPYSKKLGSLPEEGSMFKGLDEYNMRKMYDRFEKMDIWDRLKLVKGAQIDFRSTERMVYLEYILLCWMEREVNWLKVSESIEFTHNGYGGGAGFLNPSSNVTSKINLAEIENPNPFFEINPAELTLPKGATVKREVIDGMVNLRIKTDTGLLTISMQPSGGGVFDEKLPSRLIQNMSIFAKGQLGEILPPELWADYPAIIFKYSVDRNSQFSDQAKSEIDWLKKIDIHLYKDFSWDLLREFLSFDYKAALDLYRQYVAKVSSAN